MKILFIVPYVPDLIRVRPYNLIRYLSQLGNEVTVLTLWTNEQEKRAVYRHPAGDDADRRGYAQGANQDEKDHLKRHKTLLLRPDHYVWLTGIEQFLLGQNEIAAVVVRHSKLVA